MQNSFDNRWANVVPPSLAPDGDETAFEGGFLDDLARELASQPAPEVWIPVRRRKRKIVRKSLMAVSGLAIVGVAGQQALAFQDRQATKSAEVAFAGQFAEVESASATPSGPKNALVRSAEDKRALSYLLAARVPVTTAGFESDYTLASAEKLREEEPGTTWVDGNKDSTSPEVISVLATRSKWIGASLSNSGVCMMMVVTERDGTMYAKKDVGVGGQCRGTDKPGELSEEP